MRLHPSVLLLPLLAASCVRAPPPGRLPRTLRSLQPSCGDLAAFRAQALLHASTDERALLSSWSPPAPPPEAARELVLSLARIYVHQCGTEEAARLTEQLVTFPTVAAEHGAGQGPAFEAMSAFLRTWAGEQGLSFAVIGEHDAWEVSLGEGPAGIGFILHGDVVPAAEASARWEGEVPFGWTRPPFRATREGERLYGRGTEDDKGPIAASLTVMRTLAAFGLRPRERMVAIIGTGEEHDWAGMERYVEKTPPPRFPISVDSAFPVVVAESGWVGWHLTAGEGPAADCAQVEAAHGGEFITQVPGHAWMTVGPPPGTAIADFVSRGSGVAREVGAELGAPFRVEVSEEEGQLRVDAFGQAIHSSGADAGHNALWALGRAAERLEVCPTGAGTLLRVLAQQLARDHFGERLGLAHSHPIHGPLLVAPTLLRSGPSTPATLSVNLRRPAGKDEAAFHAALDGALARLAAEYGPHLTEARDRRVVGDPHITDSEGPLVQTLLEVYRELAEAPGAAPLAIRGGTYARLFPGAVSFGPGLPGQPYLGHAPDEYIELPALGFLVRALFEASARLDALEP